MCLGRLTAEKWKKIAWVLAANVQQLQAGKTVSLWTAQLYDEWVVAQCMEAVECRTSYGKVGAEFTFRILTGSAAAVTVKKFWSRRFCQFLSRKVGFTYDNKALPFRRLTELVGLRLMFLLESAKSLESVYFDKVDVTSGLLTYNRRLLKARNRIKFECPHKYRHPCVLCPIGYDRCSLAVHSSTYVRRVCEGCKQEGWFEPTSSVSDGCVECQRKERFKREQQK